MLSYCREVDLINPLLNCFFWHTLLKSLCKCRPNNCLSEDYLYGHFCEKRDWNKSESLR